MISLGLEPGVMFIIGLVAGLVAATGASVGMDVHWLGLLIIGLGGGR